MASVTQRINNFLGGVSRQTDDKKLPGQVRECLNGFPDPTFGLTKRPGFKFLQTLQDTNGNNLSKSTLENAKWFFIARDEDEKYVGCVTKKVGNLDGSIYIWNAADGTACNVSYTIYNGTSCQTYLDQLLPINKYKLTTIQDTTIVTNTAKTVLKVPDPTFIANTRATLILTDTAISSTYSVTMNAGGGANDQTFTTTTSSSETYDGLLNTLKNGIDGFGISGVVVTKFLGGLQIEREVSGTRTPFTITCKGGAANNKLAVFQDQVDNVSQLPAQAFHNHVVKILNTNSSADTYFAKFIADDGISGRGHWEEGRDPSASSGLDVSTMPHELINNAPNSFVFRRVDYKERFVGDDATNSHPSFVDKQIQDSFFYNNRLGFLATDNVSMSQAGDFFNFYHTSAQIITQADPVDLSCSSIRPAALHAVIPTAAGLFLFSGKEQFLMFSDTGVLTPGLTVIKSISNYEMDPVINPVQTGDIINFLTKTPSYTRVFSMQPRGVQQQPNVIDVSRVVKEWIPANMTSLNTSVQNKLLTLSGNASKYIYFFRTYSDGEQNLMESWFNWELPGTVQTSAIDEDDMYAVCFLNNNAVLLQAALSQSPEQAIIVNNQGQKVNPCMDLYATASSVTYDSAGKFSKCYLPYNLTQWSDLNDLTPVLVISGSTAAGTFVQSGFTMTPEYVIDGFQAYFKVPNQDLTGVASNVIVGFKYDFDITLPKLYMQLNDRGSTSDFTASLVVSRMKFAVGLSGLMSFKLFQKGRLSGARSYIADGTTTTFEWTKDDLNYIDNDQIKVKINNVASTAYTVDTTGALPKITLNTPSSELRTLSGDGTTETFDLTYEPVNLTKVRVEVDNVLQDSSSYNIVKNFITFNTAPAVGTSNIRVYSADEIVIYLDEWYNLNPTQEADFYLADDVPLEDQSVFTIPIHQRSKNFQLRIFNDSPYPVSLNSMMWEGHYTPRFYRRS